MQLGDVLYVKRGAYGEEWNGWPMVLDMIDGDEIKFRYQGQHGGNYLHYYTTYNVERVGNYLEMVQCE